ncbi:MAG: hypothetical protein HY897_04165 [Deltaproteobacteria bacterium]|nr:hypothetical protein [Deltaproteobacteria bacterium]
MSTPHRGSCLLIVLSFTASACYDPYDTGGAGRDAGTMDAGGADAGADSSDSSGGSRDVAGNGDADSTGDSGTDSSLPSDDSFDGAWDGSHDAADGGDGGGADACTDHCQNGNADCGETGVDCGGECGPCADPCTDHCQNGNADCGETGVDCGGECAPCEDPCAGHCTNGKTDCGETGEDCGGDCPDCGPSGLLFSDPIPKATTDSDYYDASVTPTFAGTVKGNAFCGDAHFTFPTIAAGSFELEIQGIHWQDCNAHQDFFVGFWDDDSSNRDRAGYNYSCVEVPAGPPMRLMTGLSKRSTCDPPRNMYNPFPAPGANDYHAFTFRWDEATVAIYEGTGPGAKLLKEMDNEIGDRAWNGTKCADPIGPFGPIVPVELDIPLPGESEHNTYCFKNLRLTRLR